MTDGEFRFRETELSVKSFLRDGVPAVVIMSVALGLSVWLPIESDTGLRPVESSLLVIVGSLAAMGWIVVRRLGRLRRRVLGITAEAIRVYPPTSLLATPNQSIRPAMEIPRSDVIEVAVAPLAGLEGSIARRKFGWSPNQCRVRTGRQVHCFDDLRWAPEIATTTRLERDRSGSACRARPGLEAALRLAGYPTARRQGSR